MNEPANPPAHVPRVLAKDRPGFAYPTPDEINRRARISLQRLEACLACPTPCNPIPDRTDLKAQCPLPKPRWVDPATITATTGIGSLVERVVKPVGMLLKLSCYEKNGQLNPESGCAKRRDRLNQLFKS